MSSKADYDFGKSAARYRCGCERDDSAGSQGNITSGLRCASRERDGGRGARDAIDVEWVGILSIDGSITHDEFGAIRFHCRAGDGFGLLYTICVYVRYFVCGAPCKEV